jgi:hypothetical protein
MVPGWRIPKEKYGRAHPRQELAIMGPEYFLAIQRWLASGNVLENTGSAHPGQIRRELLQE